jgi:hypothetical protein
VAACDDEAVHDDNAKDSYLRWEKSSVALATGAQQFTRLGFERKRGLRQRVLRRVWSSSARLGPSRRWG